MTSSFPGRIFPEMQELVQRLHEHGCEIWAVSSSNEWVIRAGMKQFGIPARSNSRGARSSLQNGIVTESLGPRAIGSRQTEGFARGREEGD